MTLLRLNHHRCPCANLLDSDLEEKVDAIMRELDLRDQKIAAELSQQIQERLPQPKRRERLTKDS
jgi:hypothetical protein